MPQKKHIQNTVQNRRWIMPTLTLDVYNFFSKQAKATKLNHLS